jgi:hypothetical protein
MYAIMFDNITVALSYELEGTKRFRLVENLPSFFIPQDLFLGRNEISIYELDMWLEDRIFPSDRVGVKKILKSLSLKKYDVLDIVKITRACLMEDGWWIAMSPEDSFSLVTIRGIFGRPELNIEDYK